MIRGVFILTATGNILFEKVWAPIPVLDTKVCCCCLSPFYLQ